MTVRSPLISPSRQHPQISPLKPFHHRPQGLGLDDPDLIAPLVEVPNHLDPAGTPDDLPVIYVEASIEGVRFRPLRVSPDGDFADRWPHGFFAERAEELF